MPVGSGEGLGLPRTRKFACPADSGWVARQDGWALGVQKGKRHIFALEMAILGLINRSEWEQKAWSRDKG